MLVVMEVVAGLVEVWKLVVGVVMVWVLVAIVISGRNKYLQ